MPIEKNAKVDENSNCDYASNREYSGTEYSFNGEFSDNIVDSDNDDVNHKMDDGTVHKCNKMLSTHTKLLNSVGKSFR